MRKALMTGCAAALLLALSPTTASAEALMMPERQALAGSPVVVWGATTTTVAAQWSIDFGDGTSTAFAAVPATRGYLATAHTYAPGTYIATISIKVGATVTEQASVPIQVFDGAGLTAAQLRSLRINMTIQDGLRYLWSTQTDRTLVPTITGATGGSRAYTALAIAAFQNQGYRLPNDDTAPTGIYEKYFVQRALHHVTAGLSSLTLTVQPAGDPCVGLTVTPCLGLRLTDNAEGYVTPMAMLAIASSGALDRHNNGVTTGPTAGKTYREILQRLSNTMAWGLYDPTTHPQRGGWNYGFNSGFDGSIMGWGILAMLDAEASGIVIPAFVRPEMAIGTTNALNNDGTYDYNADGNPANRIYVNPAKTGTGLMALFYKGETAPFPAGSSGAKALEYLRKGWAGTAQAGDYPSTCAPTIMNKGCAYAMFNIFKGLRLAGVDMLPAVGALPEVDWYAEYQDWLLTNQTAPGTVGGGNWGTMRFALGGGIEHAPSAALAELILSPVALVLPDPVKFATIGLQPFTATATEGGQHTLTAKAEATNGAPVPGATVNFTVLTGPNTGQTGSGVTNANGETTFTYTDTSTGGGTDTIRANIGTLNSNTVEMIWTPRNRPPVAVDDAYSTGEDVALNGNVTGNDSDPDGDTLTAALVSGPSNGVLVFNPDGSFTYTPAANWSGSDSFTYKLNDGTVDSNVATVAITVNPVNDPPVCTAAAPSVPDIWPADNQFVSISIGGVTDPIEGMAVTFNIDSIFQDEAVGSGNNGGNGPDGMGVGTSTAQVRAQRSGNGSNGRVYTISFTATDSGGATCSGTVTVGVRHDNSGAPAVNDGPLFDSTIAPDNGSSKK